MTLDLATVDLKGRGTPRPLGLLYVALSRVRRLDHLAIFADITLDDIRPNVTRELEVRWLDEVRRAPQILLPALYGSTPRTPDLPSSNAPSSCVLDGGVYPAREG
ncbi:hypothetical protein E4U58_001135 [Claviceps cyperi]|nr:hypothetical protein E4U58_001135 [Claviceps cyperi]